MKRKIKFCKNFNLLFMDKNINEKAAGNEFFDSKPYQWIRNLSIISLMFIIVFPYSLLFSRRVTSQALDDPLVFVIYAIYSTYLSAIINQIVVIFFLVILPAFFYTLAIEKGRKSRAFLNGVFLLISIVFVIMSITTLYIITL